MDIQLEKNSSTEALIKIKLKETDYQSNLKEKLKSYGKKASIKGFRPGKVPASLIEKMYGKSIKAEEIQKLLSDSLKEYIQKNDLKTIGEPLPNQDKAKDIDWDTQKDFEFEFSIGLIEDFDYNLDVKLDKYQIEVDKKVLDDAIEDLKKQYGNMTNPDVSEAGDSIFGTLSQSASDFSKDCLIEIEKVSEEVKNSFIGIKKEDVVKVDIQKLFSDEKTLEEVSGLTDAETKALAGEFEFTVKNVNRVTPAELNQEFFDKVFGKDKVSSEQEFMDEYSKIYEENYDRESEYLLAHQLQEKILEETKLNVPEGFYKKWVLATNEGIKEEDLDKDFEHYLRDLKWTLIKNKIADDNDLKVEYADTVAYTIKMFQAQFGGMAMTEEMEKNMEVMANNYLQQNNGENYMNVFSQLRTEKILEVIKEKADISIEKVSREEFEKKAEKK